VTSHEMVLQQLKLGIKTHFSTHFHWGRRGWHRLTHLLPRTYKSWALIGAYAVTHAGIRAHDIAGPFAGNSPPFHRQGRSLEDAVSGPIRQTLWDELSVRSALTEHRPQTPCRGIPALPNVRRPDGTRMYRCSIAQGTSCIRTPLTGHLAG
jgi:hypothetical protein